MRQGNAAEALKIAERAQAKTPSDPCDPLCWRIRLQRAELHLQKAEPAKAAELLELDVPAGAQFDSARYRQAFVRAFRWRRPPKLENLQRDSQGCLAAKQAEPGTYLDCLLLRAVATFDSGQHDEGERLIRDAISQASALRDPFRHPMAWVNLSYAFLQLRRYDDAARAATAAVRLAEGEDNAARPMALVNAGAAARQVGDFERSIGFLRQALQAIPPDVPIRRLHVLNEIGLTYFALGQRAEAADALRQALDLARKLGNAGELRRVSGNLAMAAIGAGDLATAKSALADLENAAGQTPDNPVLAIRRGHLALAEQRWKDAAMQFELASAKAAEPALLQDAFHGLALAHRGLGNRPQATRAFESAIAVIAKARRELSGIDYQLSYLTQPIHVFQAYARHLEELGDREGAFRVQESSRARVLADSEQSPSLAQLQDLARRTGTVFLSYWLDPERPTARVIAAGIHETAPLTGKVARIEALVARHRQIVEEEFGDPLVEGSAASRELSDLVLLPVQRLIPPGSRVILIPDGALHELNFETLPGPGPLARYWIEDVTLSIAPAHRVLAAAKPRAPARSLLILGDPDAADSGYRKLDHAALEIESVRTQFGAKAVVHRGPEATPAAWFAARPASFSHIHFTAHARALRDVPLDSFIVLSRSGDKFKLFARDTMSTELDAELVTLSACQSAGGRAYAGDGMIGLSWALMKAGAGNVIAGLWDVADRSTADLMAALYAALAAGSPPAEALRTAKLGLLASKGNYRKPFYWGPFQTYSKNLVAK